MPEVRAYLDHRGRSPFDRWLDDLPLHVQNRIHQLLARMSEGNFGDTRGVGDGVLERRVHFGPGYRIYFAWDGPTLIILLGGGDKSDQRSNIATSKVRWRDHKIRTDQGD